jgi:N-acetylglutamate synthase-like GNAT family acetyltransferase
MSARSGAELSFYFDEIVALSSNPKSPHDAWNDLPRFGGLSLFDTEYTELIVDEARTYAAILMRTNDVVTINILFLQIPNENGMNFEAIWNRAWSLNSHPRLTFAAMSLITIPSVTRGINNLGRSVVFKEPCLSYILSLDSWKEYLVKYGVLSDYSEFETSRIPTLDLESLSKQLLADYSQNFMLDFLIPEDAKVLNHHWKYAHGKETENMIAFGLTHRFGACIRRRQRASNDEDGSPSNGGPRGLCSWIVVRPDGSFGIMHTIESFRKRGFGHAVAIFAILMLYEWKQKKIQELERDDSSELKKAQRKALEFVRPYVHIKIGNEQSEHVFLKLNFEPTQYCTWLGAWELCPRFIFRKCNLALNEYEKMDLLMLINTSYKEDDAFFVDQWRTNFEEIEEMSKKGCFYVGYRIKDTEWQREGFYEFGTSLSQGVVDISVPVNTKPSYETNELLSCIHIEVTEDKVAKFSLLTVSSPLKKHGVSLKVLDFATVQAKSLGAIKLQVYVVSVKPWLLAYYLKMGFQVVGRESWPPCFDHQVIKPVFFHVCEKTL